METSSTLSRSLALGLALALTAHTLVSYPLPLVGEIAASTILLVLALAAGQRLFSRQPGPTLPPARIRRLFTPSLPHPLPPSPPHPLTPSSLALFLLVFSATVTVQALVAQEIYGPLRAIDSTPGYAVCARLLHYLVVVAVVLAGRERSRAVGLGAAMVYTSVFYCPTFATPEATPPFIPLAALALVLLANHVSPLRLCSGQGFTFHISRLTSHVSRLTPLVLFTLLVLASSLFSYSQHDSLTWSLKLLTLLVFTLSVPVYIHTPVQWRRMALLVVILSVLVPVSLSAAKLIELTWQLGTWPAVQYRIGLTELGRANLIARTLMVGAPLLIAQAIASTRRTRRILWWGLSALALLAFVTCQSWGGWIGLGVTCAFAVILQYGQRWIAWWRTRRSGLGQCLSYVAIIVIVGVGFLGLLRLAPQSNVGSFNGRLFQFRAALVEIAHHPLLGVGPGHHFLKSRYTSGLGWLLDTQVTLDDPLRPVYHLRGSTALHTHNLFLEIGVGSGLPGLAAFVWFLVALFRFGLQMRARSRGQNRILLTGCLVGIVASLGWGLLDVMEISPPFFTFPTWALVGLLLAAPRAFGEQGSGGAEEQGSKEARRRGSFITRFTHHVSRITFHASRFMSHVSRFTFYALCFGLVYIAIIAPLLGNTHYRAAYIAYQEQRWVTAAAELAQAARWEPLNAKYQQLRGEALMNLGRYDEAIAAYERAVRLKRDFAPYHAQLGWFYWLQGDLDQATMHFQTAVEMDPREAWRDGLHADLGLAYVAQGSGGAGEQGGRGARGQAGVEEAIWSFKETIELDPQMATAPYWVPVQGADGTFDVVLDPVYVRGSRGAGVQGSGWDGDPLQARILAHLGKADYTPRLFLPSSAPPHLRTSAPLLSFNQVLDAIEADYTAARAAGSREAQRLLATVAQAARLVGLHDHAERAYLAFQEAYPGSAYGFRDLGKLYREQGRLEEAQRMLERAVEVSPRDITSWIGLTEVYLDRGMWENAEQALDTIYRLAPLDSRLYALRAQLYRGQGDLARAADNLRKSLFIRESIPNRLVLADLYHQLGQFQQATKQCTQAADALLRTWPRLLDPQLWDIAVCLAQSDDDPQFAIRNSSFIIRHSSSVIRHVLRGHIYRARGELEQALAAYQAAVDASPLISGGIEGGLSAPHYFLGETYQALGQWESAEAAYRRAAQLDPLESLPLLALGRMQWSQGRQDAALESFRAAVEATPGWGQAHVALGNALLALGDRDGAAEHYRLAQIADGDIREGVVYDFAAHLAEADIQSPSPDHVRNDYFTINGDRRRVLFAHPDSRVRYRLTLPASPLTSGGTEGGPPSPLISGGTEGGLTLVFDVATSPESWSLEGDGVTFAVYVESDQDTQHPTSNTQYPISNTQQLFSTYVDPKRNDSDRRWHPHVVDLSDYAGQTVTIVFETGTGPAGDYRYDWAGWGSPRLLGW